MVRVLVTTRASFVVKVKRNDFVFSACSSDFMAFGASNGDVRPGQREICWRPGMIKSRCQPRVKRVTHLAVLRKLAGDVIWIGGLLKICPVTGNASGRKPLELPHRGTLVTILALRCRVGPE